MRVLKDFVHSFDFVRMKPDRSVVAAPEGLAVQALVEKGRQYAVYLHAPVGEGNFAARWTGRIDPPASGTYRLTTVSDDGVRLWLDGKLDDRELERPRADRGPRDGRARGGPSGRAEARVLPGRRGRDGPAEVDAAGRDDRGDPGGPTLPPDGSGPGLRAEYFEGRTFDEPAAVRNDPTIDFEWPPAPRPIARKAAGGTVEIALDLPAGRYRAEWIDPKTGRSLKGEDLDHAGGRKSLTSRRSTRTSPWRCGAPVERSAGCRPERLVAGASGLC